MPNETAVKKTTTNKQKTKTKNKTTTTTKNAGCLVRIFRGLLKETAVIRFAFLYRLVGLVVLEWQTRDSSPAFSVGIFPNRTSDLKICTPVVTLPGARVSTGSGRPGDSIL